MIIQVKHNDDDGAIATMIAMTMIAMTIEVTLSEPMTEFHLLRHLGAEAHGR